MIDRLAPPQNFQLVDWTSPPAVKFIRLVDLWPLKKITAGATRHVLY